MLYIEKIIDSVLETINYYVNSQALSIILFTVLTRIILLPLSIKQLKFMKLSKKAQPEIDRAKKLYAGDSARINSEIANVYRKYNLNPLTGCLPLIVQLPIMFSVFRALRDTSFVHSTSKFLGWSLLAPDTTYIFPAINAVMMILGNRKSFGQDSKTSLIQSLSITAMIFYFSLKWSVALHLYFITSSISSLIQDYFVERYMAER